MLTYNQKDDFILDVSPKDGILIIDFNSQNALVSKSNEMFAEHFPLAHAKLLKYLAKGETLYNGAYPFEERNYKLVVIVAQMAVVGPDTCLAQDIATITSGLIDSIVKKYGAEQHYISSMMYKDAGAWKAITKKIKKLNLKWSAYAN